MNESTNCAICDLMANERMWYPIETAPDNCKKIFVVIAIDTLIHGIKYTSDPYCVWVENGKFIRWPHKFNPTHWMPLPDKPKE